MAGNAGGTGPGRGKTIRQVDVVFPAPDGLRLAGTITLPQKPAALCACSFTATAPTETSSGCSPASRPLEKVGIASLRFDLRGHGASEGRQEDQTLSAHLNDV